jgi:hypothetical protein
MGSDEKPGKWTKRAAVSAVAAASFLGGRESVSNPTPAQEQLAAAIDEAHETQPPIPVSDDSGFRTAAFYTDPALINVLSDQIKKLLAEALNGSTLNEQHEYLTAIGDVFKKQENGDRAKILRNIPLADDKTCAELIAMTPGSNPYEGRTDEEKTRLKAHLAKAIETVSSVLNNLDARKSFAEVGGRF